MSNIAIVDYGAGNVRSVQNAFEYLGFDAKITSDPESIASSLAVVVPGQGSAAPAMANLKATGMDAAIKEFIKNGKPFLGVCLGLQLLFERSDENDTTCLGVFSGTVRKFPDSQKIPQIGWNSVEILQKHTIFDGIPNNNYFYFANSYYVEPVDQGSVLGSTFYGLDFSSVIAKANVVAAQFHPEKSGAVGLRFYSNFIRNFINNL